MNIKFPSNGKTGTADIEAFILPVGFWAEAVSEDKQYLVKNDQNIEVGSCSVEDDFILISFDDSRPGLAFAQAFGMDHPQHNPLQPVFGFVYQTENGKYQLDQLPLTVRDEALKRLRHYAGAGNAYFVSFKRGNWDDNHILTETMFAINFTGQVEENMGEQYLELGNIENEKTM